MNEIAGLIVIILVFIFAIFLVTIGYKLLKSGNKPEKGGIEFIGFKINLETTVGGFALALAAIVVIFFISKFYS